MSHESPKNNESVRDRLIELLKTQGIDSDESRWAMYDWVRRQEGIVEEAGTREARILYEIERADIYLDAGFIEEGKIALEEALIVANQERLAEFQEKIKRKLASL